MRQTREERIPMRPRAPLLGTAVAAAASAAVLCACGRVVGTGFTGQAQGSQALRGVASSQLLRRAEANPFDPFGLTGAVKDAMVGDQPNEEPSENDERMMKEIFDKFDLDKDGILNIDEFNALQLTTEGNDAVYTTDQLKDLLKSVNSAIKEPENGMPYADYRSLYVDRRLRQAYGTDVVRDHLKVFGPGGGGAAAEPEVEAAATDKYPLGSSVKIEGLKGAAELNGQTAEVVRPGKDEAELAAEGRVIVKLKDGERIALKPANLVSL